MIVVKADHERSKDVRIGIHRGSDHMTFGNGHARHESNTVSATASGAALGAVGGFAVLPVAGGLIGSVVGGLAGLLVGLVTDAAHSDEDHPKVKSRARN